jgi:hypothetical protein
MMYGRPTDLAVFTFSIKWDTSLTVTAWFIAPPIVDSFEKVYR